jgi:hypothetical protein
MRRIGPVSRKKHVVNFGSRIENICVDVNIILKWRVAKPQKKFLDFRLRNLLYCAII